MKLKWRRLSDKTLFEKVLDFASEADTIDILGYYVKPHEVFSHINIPLYVTKFEAVTYIYHFTKYSSDFVRNNINYDINSNENVHLSIDFMCKFDLVRVIEPNCHVPIDSYLRVMLKINPDNSKMKYIEDEIF